MSPDWTPPRSWPLSPAGGQAVDREIVVSGTEPAPQETNFLVNHGTGRTPSHVHALVLLFFHLPAQDGLLMPPTSSRDL